MGAALTDSAQLDSLGSVHRALLWGILSGNREKWERPEFRESHSGSLPSLPEPTQNRHQGTERMPLALAQGRRKGTQHRQNMKIPPLDCLSPFSSATATKQPHAIGAGKTDYRSQTLRKGNHPFPPTFYPPFLGPKCADSCGRTVYKTQ